jgi:hypothetical protein
MNFVYTRRGGPLVKWDGRTAPSQTRAGETRSLGSFDYDIPRPGAPEVVGGYESPAPGAAVIHFGGYMPEGAARGYGQRFLGADAPAAPAPAQFNLGLIRKAAVLASAYHGVKRNHGSVWWGLLWALGAYVAPVYGVSAIGIAVAQGFGQPKLKQNPARRRGKKRGRRTAARLGWARRRKHGTGRIPANVARRKRRHKKMARLIAAADWSPSGLRRAGFRTRR